MSITKYGVAEEALSKTATERDEEPKKAKVGQTVCRKCMQPDTEGHNCPGGCAGTA